MPDAGEAVCRACRLVQAQGGRCAGCGREELVGLARLDALVRPTVRLGLARYPHAMPTVIGWGLIALTLTFCGVRTGAPWGGLAAILVATGVVLSTHLTLVRGRRVLPVALPAPVAAAPAAVGVARVRATPVRAVISGREALAVSTTVSSVRDGRVYFRRVSASELWLETDEGELVLVCGEVWVEPPSSAAPSALTRRPTREMLALVGVVGVSAIDEPLTIEEWAIHAGERVEAFGELRREPVAGDGYRERLGLVLRGAPGAPIRLRAA
jgi:hypothetical protein